MQIFNWFIGFASGFGEWCQAVFDWGTKDIISIGGFSINAFGLIIGGGFATLVVHWLVKLVLPN